MVVVTDLLTVARKLNNYEADATGGTLWTSTTTFKCTVPVGKRWEFLFGYHKRDVSSTALVEIRDVSDDIIGSLDYQGAATAGVGYPNTSAGNNTLPKGRVVLDVGEYILITFGTAQGVGAYASCVVLEVDV